jgi:hypothetical protein
MWAGGFRTAQDHGLRRSSDHVELDTDEVWDDTPHEPDLHPEGMDDTYRLHPLANPTPRRGPLDTGAPSTLQDTDAPTARPLRLHGFSAEITMEITTEDGNDFATVMYLEVLG